MFLKLSIVWLGLLSCINCDLCTNITCPSIPQHYRELGCVPKKSDGDCCETRFECQDYTSFDINKCHYKGRAYDVGAEAPADFPDSCEKSCSCRSGNPPGRPAQFECGDFIDCPIQKEFHLKYCVEQHKTGVCCPDLKCSEEIEKLNTCTLDGITYKAGELMNPQSFPCQTCVCSDNFDNSTIVGNPSCSEVNCGFARSYVHQFQMGCVPLYFQSYGCCTVAFRCPNEKDVIKKTSVNEAIGTTNTALQCKFGSLSLNLGEELDINDPCTSCSCTVPPMLHCIRKNNCLIVLNQKV